jgi:hypothetical protein
MAIIGINTKSQKGRIFMSKIPQEVIKELIRGQKFTNTHEVMDAIKEMFKDVRLCEKHEKSSKKS